ncbi:MAG: TIGR03936 family radical SAM-associated protein [Clostridia bacterium]|nr:TIGR03936 family radical SAM-associated protein [Clostridia bacterium]
MIYRLKFEKREEVKYIGHLDMMRTFTRCIKKTNLPIKFSSGFNPRVQIAFALPLAVGVTSESEYMDLELNGEPEVEEVLKELKKVMPEGFKMLTCEKLDKPKSLMSLVQEAIYEVNVLVNLDDINDTIAKVKEEFDKEQLLVTKQSKNGQEEEIDIKPLIIDYKVEEITYSSFCITVHSFAGSKKNLNPNFIMEVIYKAITKDAVEDYNIHRKELILEKLT